MSKFEADLVVKNIFSCVQKISSNPLYSSVKDQCVALYENVTAENAAQTLKEIVALQDGVNKQERLFFQQFYVAGIAGGAAVAVCARWCKDSWWRDNVTAIGILMLGFSMIGYMEADL